MTLEDLKGVGKAKLGCFNKMNIMTLGDLLSHFPKRYEDRRICRSLREYLSESEERFPVEVKVLGYDYILNKGKKILKVVVTDGTMRASLVCFNRNFLKNKLLEDKEYIVFGDFQYKYDELQASQFEFIPKGSAGESLNFLRIVPIYQLTEGITQNFLREVLYQALLSSTFEKSLPSVLLNKHHLMSKKDSFFQIHFPDSFEQLEDAIYRLKYYELFELETNVALKKHFFTHQKKKKYTKNISDKSSKVMPELLVQLPFKLTKGQKTAYIDIERDLLSNYPMHRLIQGDVGSGKTLVSAMAMLMAVENGFQAALMVPTEILARQHYQTFKKMCDPLSIEVDLLISGLKTAERRTTLTRLLGGTTQILIGTHALFSDDVVYRNLGLVVIDEQHKFGVWERAKLVDKNEGLDLLVMTATPIPRTLSMTVYGDMDVSIIPDKPRQGVKVKSHCIFNNEKRKSMFQFLDKQLEQGRQGFVVCPLIEESEKLDAASATEVYEEIVNDLLPHRRIALLHGRMSTEEKDQIMTDFVNKKYDILVSTSVIEVGVDVPNATFMIVENADRFGLSQLHQLRGRIGRGQYESYCFFTVPLSISDEGKSRLRAMISHHDGFALAEEDLKIRGPGEFLGTKQSGLDSLKLANLIKDEEILLKAKEDAFNLVKVDPNFQQPEHQVLQKTIYKRFIEKHRFLLTN